MRAVFRQRGANGTTFMLRATVEAAARIPVGGRSCLPSSPSRLLKFVFEGGGCATLIQDRALRRMKDSARPGPGFENFAPFASIGVFQQPASVRTRLGFLPARTTWRGPPAPCPYRYAA